jgi:hypothetical protein
VTSIDASGPPLPEDREALCALVQSLLAEREQQQQQAEISNAHSSNNNAVAKNSS